MPHLSAHELLVAGCIGYPRSSMHVGFVDVTFHGYAPTGARIDLVAEDRSIVVAIVRFRNRPRTFRGKTRVTRGELDAWVARLREVAEPVGPEGELPVRGGEASDDVHIALDGIEPPLHYIDRGSRTERTRELAEIVEELADSLTRARDWEEVSPPPRAARRRLAGMLWTIAIYLGWITAAALLGCPLECARG